MTISSKAWINYVNKMKKIDDSASREVSKFISGFKDENGNSFSYKNAAHMRELVDFSYGISTQFGEGAASLACEMYDAIAEQSGKVIKAAEPADVASYSDVSRAVRGASAITDDTDYIASQVGRMVKRTGADTVLINAKRDNAEFAWIPNGDTCAFCVALASRGWQRISSATFKNGHAEHIHANCDCEYVVRFDKNTNVKGYDPEVYRKMYDDAEGRTSEQRINSMRRMFYAENKGIVEDESSKAEELISDVFKFNKIDFTSAKSIEEAEAYANDNFISGGFNLTGKNISYKGFDVDVANQINHRLGEIYNDFNIPKLSSLESYGKANKRAWNGNSEAPMFTTNFGNIGLNNTLIKSQKLIDKYNEQGKKSFQYVLDNIDVLKGESRKQAEAYKIAGRSLVGNSVEDFITHEIGHHISYIPEVNKTLSQIQSDTNWKDFAQNLSGYSTHSFGEYFAESFNAFCKGEQDKLQPELIEIFEGIRRK